MRLTIPPLKRLALVLLVVTPLAAWALVKPVRVVAPSLAGVTCLSHSLCLDEQTRQDEALQLYADALAFVAGHVGDIRKPPRFVFCSTPVCAQSFGLGERAAVTVSTFGTVISPRGWAPHFVRHEMIHHLQAERLGTLTLLRKPTWFVEGMAYALSDDPREPLAEPFEGHRRQFLRWWSALDPQRVWQEAKRL